MRFRRDGREEEGVGEDRRDAREDEDEGWRSCFHEPSGAVGR
jgi:hypothetical protein